MSSVHLISVYPTNLHLSQDLLNPTNTKERKRQQNSRLNGSSVILYYPSKYFVESEEWVLNFHILSITNIIAECNFYSPMSDTL